MNVGELVHSVDPMQVVLAIETVRPEEVGNREGYRRALAELTRLQPLPTAMRCRIAFADPGMVRDGLCDADEIDVYCLRPDDADRYAIDFVSWRECLSMDLDIAPDLEPMLPHEALAHVLYEITSAGFDAATVEAEIDRIRTHLTEVLDAETAAWRRSLN